MDFDNHQTEVSTNQGRPYGNTLYEKRQEAAGEAAAGKGRQVIKRGRYICRLLIGLAEITQLTSYFKRYCTAVMVGQSRQNANGYAYVIVMKTICGKLATMG